MPSASTPPSLVNTLMMGVVGSALIIMSTTPQGSKLNSQLECERGILDAGENGMNVLVYELCLDRMTVGFESSDVVEEILCLQNGDIQLWLLTDGARCDGHPAYTNDQVYELWEPLRGVDRSTAAPVRQLLTCRMGISNRATTVVPDARDAILETRAGDSKYERLTRQFISQCIRPDA